MLRSKVVLTNYTLRQAVKDLSVIRDLKIVWLRSDRCNQSKLPCWSYREIYVNIILASNAESSKSSRVFQLKCYTNLACVHTSCFSLRAIAFLMFAVN